MSDQRLRDLERAAAQGDPAAVARLKREQDRLGSMHSVLVTAVREILALESTAEKLGRLVVVFDELGDDAICLLPVLVAAGVRVPELIRAARDQRDSGLLNRLRTLLTPVRGADSLQRELAAMEFKVANGQRAINVGEEIGISLNEIKSELASHQEQLVDLQRRAAVVEQPVLKTSRRRARA